MSASAVSKVTSRAEQADNQVNQIINDIQKSLNVKVNTNQQNMRDLLVKATDANKK